MVANVCSRAKRDFLRLLVLPATGQHTTAPDHLPAGCCRVPATHCRRPALRPAFRCCASARNWSHRRIRRSSAAAGRARPKAGVSSGSSSGASSSASLASRSNAQRPLLHFQLIETFCSVVVKCWAARPRSTADPASPAPGFRGCGTGSATQQIRPAPRLLLPATIGVSFTCPFQNFGTSAVTHRSRFLFVSKARRW